jgi:hypothetical protein
VRIILLAALAALLAVPRAEAAAPAGEPFDIVYLSQSRPVIVRLKIDSSGQPLREAWHAFVDALFDRLDADKNGIVDEKEAKKLKTLLSLLGGQNNPQQGRQPQRMGNGQPMPRPPEITSLTRGELADYLLKHDLGPLRLPPPYNPQPQMNGFFSRGRQPSAEDLDKAFLDLLDANKDGKFSAAELEAGIAILAKLDADENDLLSMDEITRQPRSPFFFDQVMQQRGSPVAELLPLSRKGADSVLAKRLLARYGPKPRGGNQQPTLYSASPFGGSAVPVPPSNAVRESTARKITKKEINLTGALFARFDQDGDGELDAEELARVGQTAVPEVEIALRLGLRPRGTNPAEVRRGGAAPVKTALDAAGDASIEVPGFCLDFKTPPAMNPRDAKASIRARYLERFKTIDRDMNGYLTRDEAQSDALFNGDAFAFFDKNNDGLLYESDIGAGLDEVGDLLAVAVRGLWLIELNETSRGLFSFIDTDRDSRLSVRELRAMPQLVARFGNKEGLLDPTKLPRRFEARLAPTADPGRGTQVQARFGMPESPTPSPVGPRWFQKMDRNRDGDLSRREFLGSDADFRKLDSNGDGLISVEEAEGK